MQIFVKTQSGEKIIIDVLLSDTISKLKIKIQIQSKDNISFKDQQLFFNNLELHDNLRLIDYNIKNESVIYLHIMSFLSKSDIAEGIVYCIEKHNENEYYEYFKIDKSPYTHRVIYGTKSNKVSIYDKLKQIKNKLKSIKEDERKKYDEFFLQQLRRCN